MTADDSKRHVERARRVQQRLGTWLLGIALTAGCGDAQPRTQVMVVVDAQSQVRDVTRTLRVKVYGGPKGEDNAWPEAGHKRFEMGKGDFEWPVRIGLVPERGGKPGDFRVELAALDEKGKLQVQRVLTGAYLSKRTLRLDVLLEDRCLRSDACEISEHFAPEDLPDYRDTEGDAGQGSGQDDAGPGDGGAQPDRDGGSGTDDDGGGTSGDDGGARDAGGVRDAGDLPDAGKPDSHMASCGDDADCDDGDPCNGKESCERGDCAAGQPLSCGEDQNTCTSAVCVPGEGCRQEDNTRDCEDDDPCTETGLCGDGSCHTLPKQCDDHSACDAQGECACEDGYARCSPDGPCEEVGMACQCGGLWMCADGARECVQQNGCELGDTCTGNECDESGYPGSCNPVLPISDQTRRCEEAPDGGECQWTRCPKIVG